MAVICDPKNKDLAEVTGNRSVPQIAAGLATAGIVSALAPPAWVIVLTTLLATKIVDTGLQALCEVWAEVRQERSSP